MTNVFEGGDLDLVGTYIRAPGFNGWAFMNATAEAVPGSAAEQAAHRLRACWTRALFTSLASDLDVRDVQGLVNKRVLIYDGALISSRMDRDDGAATEARKAAAQLLDVALRHKPLALTSLSEAHQTR